MAKKNNAARQTDEVVAPEGFTMITAPDGPQTWVKPSAGMEILGKLIGRYDRGGEDSSPFYTVELLKGGIPGKRRINEDDEELSDVTAEEGETVNVNETSSIERDLKPLSGNGGKYHVWIKFMEKVPLKKGTGTYWKVKVATKLVGGKPREIDVPF